MTRATPHRDVPASLPTFTFSINPSSPSHDAEQVLSPYCKQYYIVFASFTGSSEISVARSFAPKNLFLLTSNILSKVALEGLIEYCTVPKDSN
jgi:hypothetical protein